VHRSLFGDGPAEGELSCDLCSTGEVANSPPNLSADSAGVELPAKTSLSLPSVMTGNGRLSLMQIQLNDLDFVFAVPYIILDSGAAVDGLV
jgi:hypothetical protein